MQQGKLCFILTFKHCNCLDFKSLTFLFVCLFIKETSNSRVPLGSGAAGHWPHKRTSKVFPLTDLPLKCHFFICPEPQQMLLHSSSGICSIAFTHCLFPVYRPLHSAWLRLLWHHQGNWPQTGHRPHQAARLHRGNPRKHRPERT